MSRALILAGGLGTRLRELVPDLPKPMAPVAGVPFLEILLQSLSDKGFTETTLAVGYLAGKIESYFGNQFAAMSLRYCTESIPLGTGGAIRHGLASMPKRDAPVFVLNGDTFLDLETQQLISLWQGRPTIVAREVTDTARYGRLIAQNGRVVSFAEKGRTGPGLINAGCYVVQQDLFSAFEKLGSFSIETDFWPDAVSNQHVDCFVSHGQFIDIGIPADFNRAQTELRRFVRR